MASTDNPWDNISPPPLEVPMGDTSMQPVHVVPISLISGFLGAGKTTLLRQLLTQTSMKIGLIVNDVAAVNIDAKLVRNDNMQASAGAGGSTAEMADTVELQNGCACCTASDELLDSIDRLLSLSARRGERYDRIIMETSGVAEPQAIRDKFNDAIAYQDPIMDLVTLDTLVTVVDTSAFLQEYESRDVIANRPDLGGNEAQGGSGQRRVVDLLVEQVECADIVLLNKSDMVNEAELKHLEQVVGAINPLASAYPCTYGKVETELVFGASGQAIVSKLNTEGHHRGAVAFARSQQRKEQAEGGASAAASATAEATNPSAAAARAAATQRQETTATIRFGIRNFVYSARRPFHVQRLRSVVLAWMPVKKNTAVSHEEVAAANASASTSPMKAVIRSKGFVWLSTSHVTAHYWSHAGNFFEIRDEGDWWDAVPRDDWPQVAAQRAVIESEFEGWCGDRRQEIVFIGASMDEPAIRAQLDECLVTDDELTEYRQKYQCAEKKIEELN